MNLLFPVMLFPAFSERFHFLVGYAYGIKAIQPEVDRPNTSWFVLDEKLVSAGFFHRDLF